MLEKALIHFSKQLTQAQLQGLCGRFALIGGLAVSARGYIRATQDVDFLVETEDSRCESLASFLGATYLPPDMGDPLNGVFRCHDSAGITCQIIRLGHRLSNFALEGLSLIEVSEERVPVVGSKALIAFAGSMTDINDASEVAKTAALSADEVTELRELGATLGFSEALEQILAS